MQMKKVINQRMVNPFLFTSLLPDIPEDIAGIENSFGLTPIEAQAVGKGVIAFAKGGALETVVDGETGVLFEEQTVECLIAAIEKFNELTINPVDCSKNAEKFSKVIFRERLLELVGGLKKR